VDTIQLKKIASISYAVLVLMTACESTEQRKEKVNLAMRARAAQEIHRICALPEPERTAEIKKVKDESAMVVACGR